MNNTFNLQRFGLLLKRQWLEFGKIYLITLVVALGVIITFYAFATYGFMTGDGPLHERSLNFREPLFLILGILFITIIASSYFAHLGQKPKATIDLMIPTSTFEKFVAGIFFTAILSTISFVIIFYLTDLVFVGKLKDIYQSVTTDSFTTEAGDKIMSAKDNLGYFFTTNYPAKFASIFFLTPFFITAVFLLGSIYFQKFHYIKTAISVMIFAGIWTSIILQTARAVFEGRIEINPRSGNSTPNGLIELGMFSLMLLVTSIFWTITYVRLKEKQV